MSWEIVIESNECLQRKKSKYSGRPESEPRYDCKLSGGTCKEDICPKTRRILGSY